MTSAQILAKARKARRELREDIFRTIIGIGAWLLANYMLYKLFFPLFAFIWFLCTGEVWLYN